MITHCFFDIGGVLLSNAWDHDQRARAVEHFGLSEEFELRHEEVVGEWEVGRIGVDEYLDNTVFYTGRDFTREQFIAYMFEQSVPDPDCIALVRLLAERGSVRLFTLNNESEVLNQHRIAAFGLDQIFLGFLSSCWLGVRKPSRAIFEHALRIVQARPESTLFVDDRAQNLQPAAALGMQTHHYVGVESLQAALHGVGLL
ncbi:MAG TPA: HAD family phosphatase [Gemmatimonadaceae bacterium]|nr:HAD family phosphatase [Gemmatimonadaceae bacterium]